MTIIFYLFALCAARTPRGVFSVILKMSPVWKCRRFENVAKRPLRNRHCIGHRHEGQLLSHPKQYSYHPTPPHARLNTSARSRFFFFLPGYRLSSAHARSSLLCVSQHLLRNANLDQTRMCFVVLVFPFFAQFSLPNLYYGYMPRIFMVIQLYSAAYHAPYPDTHGSDHSGQLGKLYSVRSNCLLYVQQQHPCTRTWSIRHNRQVRTQNIVPQFHQSHETNGKNGGGRATATLSGTRP